MKTKIILLILLLSATTSFAQSVKTDVPITGLGEFYLGMTIEQAYEILIDIKTEDIQIIPLLENVIKVTNMQLAGYVFNTCFLKFNESGLRLISYIKEFDKNNKNPIEFNELVSILENDYGIQPNKETELRKKGKIDFAWSRPPEGLVGIKKQYDEKKKLNTVLIYVSK